VVALPARRLAVAPATLAVTAAQQRLHSVRHYLGLRARLGPRSGPVTEP